MRFWLSSLLILLVALGRAQVGGVGSPVEIDGNTVFNVYSRVGSVSADERAVIIGNRFQRIADDNRYNVDLISVDLTAGQADLYIGQELIASLTKEDSDAAGLSLESYSDLASRQAKGAIDAYRKDRSGSAIAQGFGRSGVAVLLTLLACWIVRWILNFATFRFYKIPRKAPLHIIVRGSKVVSRKQFKRLAQKFALLLKRVFYLAFVFVGFSYVLRQFPWTQEYGDRLFGILKAEVTKFGKSTVAQFPNFIAIGVIVLISWLVLRALKAAFTALEKGTFSWPGFDKDWAMPTYKLVRLVVLAGSLIAIFPYLPGSSSPAFQGISVFAGVLLSLGSTGAISNMVAGIVITYMRPFRLGDRIKVGETTGDVIERNLLVTRIKTIKNVEITVPNSVLLGSHVENFSSAAQSQGLILHSSVTIGYDVPWQQVHELLIGAAKSTHGVLDSPQPFVLQKALNDFYVEYEINCYTRSPKRMAVIYSDLHKGIQEQFASAGVEILSPHYQAHRNGSDYALPGDSASGLEALSGIKIDLDNGKK